MPNFGACRCGTRWHQAGNKTGYCGACHRTFGDSEGATVWRSAKVKPTDAWPARTPNPAANPPAQSRTGAGGTPEPVAIPDVPNGGRAR
jgi:hypothetical protein